MLEIGDVFDELAFHGMTTKDLISVVATNVWDSKNRDRIPGPWIYWPTREEIEGHVDALAAKYGKLGNLTRKKFVSEVDWELKRRERRRAANEGRVVYFFK